MKATNLQTHPKWHPHTRKMFGDILHIYDPIFRKNFYICSGMKPSKFVKSFKIQFNYDITYPTGSGQFCEIKRFNVPIGVIYSKDKSRTLMHECLHAALWALEDVGIKINSETEEVLAYYQDFLFKWATKK